MREHDKQIFHAMQIGIMIDQRRNEKQIVNEYSARVECSGYQQFNTLNDYRYCCVRPVKNSYRGMIE